MNLYLVKAVCRSSEGAMATTSDLFDLYVYQVVAISTAAAQNLALEHHKTEGRAQAEWVLVEEAAVAGVRLLEQTQIEEYQARALQQVQAIYRVEGKI